MSSGRADSFNAPTKATTAHDIFHFFTGIKPTRGKFSSDGEKPKAKICKLCAYVRIFCYLFYFLMTSSEKYGTDESKIPGDVPNFIYGLKTGNTNLRRHLYRAHAEEYDAAVLQNRWSYKLTSQLANAFTDNARNERDRNIPSFSPAMFVKYLIRFVVADDQVSLDDLAFLHAPKGLQSIRVVECPEFRQLCMFLRETLVDNDIPRRTRMREGVITQWRESFERLKLDLSVGVGIFSFCFINCLCHRNPAGGSVLLQMPGQTPT